MTETIGVALLGYGLAGKTFHAPLIRAVPGLDLRVVVSSDPAKVHADLPDVTVLDDAAQAVARADIDLVVVATPDDLHAPQALAALDAGKHVVIDKPFAPTLDAARAIRDRAATAGRLLSVFQNRRWDSDFLTLHALIGQGALGEVVQFESRYDRWRPVVTDRWKDRRGMGAWQDLGPHLVDQALQLFGMPEALWVDLAAQRDRASAVDYFHAVLRYPRLRVILQSGALIAASDLRYAVHGTGGSFVKYGLDPQEGQSKAGIAPGDAGWGVDPRPGALTRVIDDVPQPTEVVPSMTGDYCAYYAGVRDAILGRGANPVTPEQALDVMTILALGQQSADERREVSVAN